MLSISQSIYLSTCLSLSLQPNSIHERRWSNAPFLPSSQQHNNRKRLFKAQAYDKSPPKERETATSFHETAINLIHMAPTRGLPHSLTCLSLLIFIDPSPHPFSPIPLTNPLCPPCPWILKRNPLLGRRHSHVNQSLVISGMTH